MPIRFRCEDCEARMKVPDGSQGRRVKCPRCGTVQQVPAEAGAGAVARSPGTVASTATPAEEPRPSTLSTQTPPTSDLSKPESGETPDTRTIREPPPPPALTPPPEAPAMADRSEAEMAAAAPAGPVAEPLSTVQPDETDEVDGLALPAGTPAEIPTPGGDAGSSLFDGASPADPLDAGEDDAEEDEGEDEDGEDLEYDEDDEGDAAEEDEADEDSLDTFHVDREPSSFARAAAEAGAGVTAPGQETAAPIVPTPVRRSTPPTEIPLGRPQREDDEEGAEPAAAAAVAAPAPPMRLAPRHPTAPTFEERGRPTLPTPTSPLNGVVWLLRAAAAGAVVATLVLSIQLFVGGVSKLAVAAVAMLGLTLAGIAWGVGELAAFTMNSRR